jgi:hypothetical protein
MSDSASWDWDVVDAIARRLLELIDEREDEEVARSSLLTVGQVAARLEVGAKWVYAHQHELGVVKLGQGSEGEAALQCRSGPSPWVTASRWGSS